MSGGVRKALVILPTIITIAVIAVAGTAIITQRQERSDQVAQAERVGSEYFSEVASFQADVQKELAGVKGGDPADLKEALDEKLDQPPVLGPAPDGAESSKTYREAVKASATILDPYTSLSDKLGRAADAQSFVKAADEALGVSRDALLRFPLVFDSGPLRNQVLPSLNRALTEFRAAKVPRAAADVAVEIDRALQYLVGQVSAMADRADAGGSYEFSFGTQYDAARQAVRDYASKINGDVAEALDKISGAEPTQDGDP